MTTETKQIGKRAGDPVQVRTTFGKRKTDAIKEKRTFGEKTSDAVASFGGSWGFIICLTTVIVVWVSMNSFFLVGAKDVFDPFPYILLNLFLSMLATIQMPIILMSQNRQEAKDRIKTNIVLALNQKAEQDIARVDKHLRELQESHVEQTKLLKEIAGKS